MDNQNQPPANPVSPPPNNLTPQESNIPISHVYEHPEPHNPHPHGHHFFPSKIMISLLIILLIFVGGTGAYLANNKLKAKPKAPSPTPTVAIATPTPVDETSTWKTYQSTKYGLEFMYRPDLTVKEDADGISLSYEGSLAPNYDRIFGTHISFIDNTEDLNPHEYAENELCRNAFKMPERNIDTTENCIKLVKDNLKDYNNGKISGIQTIYNLFENPKYTIIFERNDQLILIASSGETGSGPSELGIKTIDRILSTFKFTDSSDGITCTMDAKICPDGSSVGRTGPNCEFAPCPGN